MAEDARRRAGASYFLSKNPTERDYSGGNASTLLLNAQTNRFGVKKAAIRRSFGNSVWVEFPSSGPINFETKKALLLIYDDKTLFRDGSSNWSNLRILKHSHP